jgi:DNA-binding transcriptional MocR family regulator
VPVPVDGGGLRTDALARVLRGRRVKLVYTTPAVQSPTGVALADERRTELLALAEEHQCAVVEDDYDSELRAGGPAAPALACEDAGGRVVYLGTFSKALFPALRVGYLVAAPPVVRRVAEAVGAAHFGGNLLVQAALAELLRNGALERHVRRVRRLYAERLDALLAALAAYFPEGTRARRPAGGNCVWVELPAGFDAEALARDARAHGVAVEPGAPFFHEEPDPRAFPLCFASLGPDAIAEGVARLGRLLRPMRAAGGRP